MDVKVRIKSHFAKAIAEPISDEDDIFELGYVDSMFALQLVSFVEAEFSVVAQRDELDIANFCSIAALSAFVESKLGSGARAG
jgi:methoxymalonate biosynthesis acyl carrier protein